MTDDEILAITPKRDREGRIDRLNNSTNLWVFCDICGNPFIVNQFEDRKPRTPKYKNFIVCIMCDPRHLDDRYMREGYRVIHKGKLRVVHMAMVVRQTSKWECRNPDKVKCGCASCVAKKMFPPF